MTSWLESQFSLTGKKALVTGSSKGIGASIAIAMAQAGADIVLVGRSEDSLKSTHDAIQKTGKSVETLICDVQSRSEISEAFKNIDQLNVDIAVSFASETIESFAQKNNLVHISASAQKLNPGAIANLALSIAETGGNVERIHRSASSPSTTIEFFVSGATSESLQSATNSSALNSGLNLVIQENI